MPNVISANRLADNVAVLQTAALGWSAANNCAAVGPDESAAVPRAGEDAAPSGRSAGSNVR